MPKSPSPFAGMKLTDQTPLAKPGIDQQLFSRPAPLPEKPAVTAAQEVGKEAQEKEAPMPARTSAPVKPKLPAPQTATLPTEFDLNIPTEKSETFAFTFEELLALAELKTGLSRVLGVDARVTKIDIIRCAVHMIVADYRTHGEQSFIVERFKKKKPVERTRRKKVR
jgi:hypothetical protein